jgi:hypothetical protein
LFSLLCLHKVKPGWRLENLYSGASITQGAPFGGFSARKESWLNKTNSWKAKGRSANLARGNQCLHHHPNQKYRLRNPPGEQDSFSPKGYNTGQGENSSDP